MLSLACRTICMWPHGIRNANMGLTCHPIFREFSCHTTVTANSPVVLQVPFPCTTLFRSLPGCGVSQWHPPVHGGEYARAVRTRFRAPAFGIRRVRCSAWRAGRFACGRMGSETQTWDSPATRFSENFRVTPRLPRIHPWSSRYPFPARRSSDLCQGAVYHNGTPRFMAGSMREQLALVFALLRSESDELDAQPGVPDDLHVAAWDQKRKHGTHLPPDFPRIFVSHHGYREFTRGPPGTLSLHDALPISARVRCITMAPPGSWRGVCASSWHSFSRSCVRNQTSWMLSLASRTICMW